MVMSSLDDAVSVLALRVNRQCRIGKKLHHRVPRRALPIHFFRHCTSYDASFNHKAQRSA